MSNDRFCVTRCEFGLSPGGLSAAAPMAAAQELGSAPWTGPAIVKKIYLGIPQPTWPKPTLDVKQEMAEVESNAENCNSGYILAGLDHAGTQMIPTMRAQGHAPCLALPSSPGHLQAWIRVSADPLPPALATAIDRHLARAYRADPASTDWRHLGRLAGFTNPKPQRRRPGGYAPWVKLLHAQAGLATQGAALKLAAHPFPGRDSLRRLGHSPLHNAANLSFPGCPLRPLCGPPPPRTLPPRRLRLRKAPHDPLALAGSPADHPSRSNSAGGT